MRSEPPPMGPLQTILFSWIDRGVEDAVYVFSGGEPLYCNNVFRDMFSPHEPVLAELAARPRTVPQGNGGSPICALPPQGLQKPVSEGTCIPVLAREWWVEADSGPVVVGCVAVSGHAPDADRAFWRVALHDSLTDLPSRSLFEDRLVQAIARARRGKKFAALLFVDLDGFKPINDRHGHQIGDIVLQTVGGRMLACVRETDTVARLGGDEFAIVLDQVRAPGDAERTAEKLIAAVAEPIELPDGGDVRVTCSVGISLSPTNGGTVRALVHAADQAMYRCKGGDQGAYSLSDASPDDFTEEKWMDDAEADSLGVEEIDAQHRALVALANRLYHAIEGTHDYDLQASLLDELVSFTQFHFSSEEILMDRHGDPGAEAHKRQHAQLVGQVQFFRHALTHGGGQVVLSALRPWLIRHIRTFDRGLASLVAKAAARESALAEEESSG